MITNESDRNMIKYFWESKGWISRWASWEERKEDIRKEDPILVKVIEDYEYQYELLCRLVDQL